MSAEPLRVIEGGRAPRGWEALWRKDVWCQSELPHGDLVSTYRGEEFIHFERIGQPWLKEAAKRWARARFLADTHQAETGGLLEQARKNNNVRLIEVLERDEQSLARILQGLDAIEIDHASSEELDLRDLAAPDQTGGG